MRNPDRRERLVLGREDDRLTVHLEALDRDLVLDHGHHDLARVSVLLHCHEHEIAVRCAMSFKSS